MPRFPSGPLRALTYLKYVCIPASIGAYDDTGPLNGDVPPIVIDRLVIPGTACVVVPACGRASAPGRLRVNPAPSATTVTSTFFMRFSSLRPLSDRVA